MTSVIVIVTYGFVRTSCRFAVAVHVLAMLAYKEGESLTSRLLASSVNTNPVVIRRLLLALQSAGLIETRKGAGFGSRLSCPPKQIRLSQVYRAVETEEPFSLPAQAPDQGCPVGQCIQAALQNVFASADAALERELKRTTLADILNVVQECCARSRRVRK